MTLSDPLPFSRPLAIDKLPDTGLETTIEASDQECAAIAEAVGLTAVASLSARYTIERRPGGRFQVEGRVQARITRICTVSLDPFETDVDEPIEVAFAPAPQPLPEPRIRGAKRPESRRRAEEVPAPVDVGEGEEDPPDPIIDGRIDLGTLAVEFLTLALDFYPRRPGVQFTDVVLGETEEPAPSAFAALERFKDRS